MAADPLSTVALSTVVTTVSHLIRSYTQARAKNGGALIVAEVKDRALFTTQLIKRVEKLEKDHEQCEEKHTECLLKVSVLTNQVAGLTKQAEQLEKRMTSIAQDKV